MGVDVAHLVLVAFGHAGDQVLDDGLDGTEGGDVLAGAVVDFDLLWSVLRYSLFLECVRGLGLSGATEVFWRSSGFFLCCARRRRTWMICFLGTTKVTAMWERSLTSLPRGPSTVTMRERIDTLTSSGTVRVSVDTMYLILID